MTIQQTSLTVGIATVIAAWLLLGIIPVKAEIPPQAAREGYGATEARPAYSAGCGTAVVGRHDLRSVYLTAPLCRAAVSDRRLAVSVVALLAGGGAVGTVLLRRWQFG